MLLWISFAVLTAVVLAAVLRPLWSPVASELGADATEVYRDQLAELDLELERKVIAPEEAEAARTEIARRLLAAADRPKIDAGGDRKGEITSISSRLFLPLAAAIPAACPGRPRNPPHVGSAVARATKQLCCGPAFCYARRGTAARLCPHA